MNDIKESQLIDLIQSIQKANKAKVGWSAKKLDQRVSILEPIVNKIREARGELVSLESSESGVSQQSLEKLYDDFLDHLDQLLKSNLSPGVPLGIVGVAGDFEARAPWTLYRLFAGLLRGNAVFVLSDKENIRATQKGIDIVFNGELPEGLVSSFVSEDGEFRSMFFSHPGMKGLSVKTTMEEGKNIRKLLVEDFKRCHLELDGRGVALILDPLDNQQMDNLVEGIFSYYNYYRSRPSRIFIVDKVMDEFQDELMKRVSADQRSGFDLGDITSGDLNLKWEQGIREEGRSLLNEEALSSRIMTELPNCALVQQLPVKGPFASLSRVKYPAEAIKFANTTPLGTSTSIWCKDPERFKKLSGQVESPVVLHNTSLPGFESYCHLYKSSYWGFNGEVKDLFCLKGKR